MQGSTSVGAHDAHGEARRAPRGLAGPAAPHQPPSRGESAAGAVHRSPVLASAAERAPDAGPGSPVLALLDEAAIPAQLELVDAFGFSLVRLPRGANSKQGACPADVCGRTAWVGHGRCLSASASALAFLALWPHHLQPPESSLLGEDDPWRRAEGLQHIVAWLSEVGGEQAARASVGSPVPPAAPPDPDLHPAVGVRETAAAGRGLFAERAPVHAGQLLLCEAAHAVVMRSKFRFSRCAHCLAPLGAASVAGPGCRCAGCAEVYCEPACRAAASEAWHAVECAGPRWCRVAPDVARLVARSMLRCHRPSDPSINLQRQPELHRPRHLAPVRAGASGGEAGGGDAPRGGVSDRGAEARNSFDPAAGAARLLGLRGVQLPTARASFLRLQAYLCWVCFGAALGARGWGETDLARLMEAAQTNLHAVTAQMPTEESNTGGAGGNGGSGRANAAPTLAEAVRQGTASAGARAGASGDGRSSLLEHSHVTCIGVGLFLHGSLVNHSCEPNTNVAFSHVRFTGQAASGTEVAVHADAAATTATAAVPPAVSPTTPLTCSASPSMHTPRILGPPAAAVYPPAPASPALTTAPSASPAGSAAPAFSSPPASPSFPAHSARFATLQLRSAVRVPAGSQIWTCYGPQAGHLRLSLRRQVLQAQYGFLCRCGACEREQAAAAAPHGPEDRARAPPGRGTGTESGLGTPTACERMDRHSLEAGTGMQQDSRPPMPPALDATAMLARAAALDQQARRACESGADFASAARCVRRAVALLRRVFPPGSVQLAHEQAKLAQLSFNAGEAEAEAELGEAASAMAMCYGQAHPEVEELQRLGCLARLDRARRAS